VPITSTWFRPNSSPRTPRGRDRRRTQAPRRGRGEAGDRAGRGPRSSLRRRATGRQHQPATPIANGERARITGRRQLIGQRRHGRGYGLSFGRRSFPCASRRRVNARDLFSTLDVARESRRAPLSKAIRGSVGRRAPGGSGIRCGGAAGAPLRVCDRRRAVAGGGGRAGSSGQPLST
jgi:hypothetical protein